MLVCLPRDGDVRDAIDRIRAQVGPGWRAVGVQRCGEEDDAPGLRRLELVLEREIEPADGTVRGVAPLGTA